MDVGEFLHVVKVDFVAVFDVDIKSFMVRCDNTGLLIFAEANEFWISLKFILKMIISLLSFRFVIIIISKNLILDNEHKLFVIFVIKLRGRIKGTHLAEKLNKLRTEAHACNSRVHTCTDIKGMMPAGRRRVPT